MIILLSPAKTFSKTKTTSNQIPYFQNDALSLINALKKKKISTLKESLKISDRIAHDVKSYYENFGNERLSAIHTYDGQAFKGFEVTSANQELLDKINTKLYILSGLYGILKPLDGISYYRLDIKDNIVKSLYPFWKKRIKDYLIKFHNNELIINLASKEYQKVLPKDINIVTIDFLQIQNEQYKSISMFVKRMRGMMARYLIEHDITDIEKMKSICIDGYKLDTQQSKQDLLIFSKEV